MLPVFNIRNHINIEGVTSFVVMIGGNALKERFLLYIPK